MRRARPHPRARSIAGGRPHPRGARRAGFTLIEIIAVAAIIAMILGIGIPRLGRSGYDALGGAAEELAQSLRFARQRAVMTGVPHRVLIDLEEGGYRIEWFVDDGRAFGTGDEGGDGGGGLFAALLGGGSDDEGSSDAVLDLTPRRTGERSFHPIPHASMGDFRWLDEDLYFVGIDGATGWVEGGDYALVFYEDGTTDPARVELADAEDRRLTLLLEPILERVHVRPGEARS